MISGDADYPPADSWVAAIHGSEDDFTPLGTALVIDNHRVLTCAHVVNSEGTIRKPLWVAFPKAAEGSGHRRRVDWVVLDSRRLADLAVLGIGGVPEGVTAAPLRCPRSADLAGRRWWAFGFANGDPLGNSAGGLVGASLGYGWIRLDAESRYHVEPGFSGGGLWSPDYQAVVAMVGEANDRGDGRAITLHQADMCFPGQSLRLLAEWSAEEAGELALASWGWTLERDPEARRHWRPRARGVTRDSERGYRFRGRSAALRAIAGWLDRDRPDRRALIVTGSPGVGKSAVLGRIVLTADAASAAVLPAADDAVRASLRSVACAVHAKGKTALEVASEIARAASIGLPESVADIAVALRDALSERDGRRFNVIIDALDEATTPAQARAIVTGIVLPLVETCADVGAQVIVGSRRRDEDGNLLAAFGDSMDVLDLDDPRYFSADDLTAYAIATLRLIGDERTDNPYVADDAALGLARRIAAKSDRNFLVAGLTARSHGLHDRQAADPAKVSFTATVEAAMRDYLQRVVRVAGVTAEAALTGLAFAEAPGMPMALWLVAMEAIGARAPTTEQLSRFARSSAANFLVESGGDGAEVVFRLFHQALNDALLQDRSRIVSLEDDERALTQAFVAQGKQTGWSQAPGYLLRSLASHAARAGMIDALLTDDGYLLHADLRRLVALADGVTNPAAQQRVRLLRLTPRAITASPQSRTALFSVTECLENLGHGYTTSSQPAPYRGKWAFVRPRTERAVLEGHSSGVTAICGFSLGGHPLLASSADDRTVRIWDPATGTQQAVLAGHTGAVRDICAFSLGGRTLLASGGTDRVVRIWDPATGTQQAVLEGHTGRVWAVNAVTLDGRTLLASGGTDRVVRIWDPATGRQQAVLAGHTGAVRGICAFSLGGRTLLASGGSDHMVRIWDPATGTQQLVLAGHTGAVRDICALSLGGRTLLASGGTDRTVRIWDPATGTQQLVLEGHAGRPWAVCSLSIDGRPLLASAGGQTVRIWDPVTGTQQATLGGHTGGIRAVCGFSLDGRTLLASGGTDRTVRIWDPATIAQLAVHGGHTGSVRGLCGFSLDGRALLASGGADGTVRIWDAATGSQQAVLDGHTGGVVSMCGLSLGGRALLASGGADGTVRIWDPATGSQQAVLEGHQGPAWAVCGVSLGGRTLLASGASDTTVRIWDPATGTQQAVLEGHTGRVWAVCSMSTDGRTLLASGASDMTVRTWDPATGAQQAVLEGHTGGVSSVCGLSLGGRALLASGASDRTVRIWDPATGALQAVLEGHTAAVRGICIVNRDGRMLLASCADDRTVRIWDPAIGTCLQTVPIHHTARACAYSADLLVIGLTGGLLAIDLSAGPS